MQTLLAKHWHHLPIDMVVLQEMDESGVNQVPVVEGGRLLGLITHESLLHDIWLRAELAV